MQFPYALTRAEYHQCLRLSARLKPELAQQLPRGLHLAAAIAGLMLLTGRVPSGASVGAVILILYALTGAIHAILTSHASLDQAWAETQSESLGATVEFDETGVIFRTPHRETRFFWIGITRITRMRGIVAFSSGSRLFFLPEQLCTPEVQALMDQNIPSNLPADDHARGFPVVLKSPKKRPESETSR